MFKLYIPTLGRSDTQKTLSNLTPEIRAVTHLVCPESEVLDLSLAYDVAVLGCPAKGIAATRQWIVENCDAEVCIMCDDDHDFLIRKNLADMNDWHHRNATMEEVAQLFKDMALKIVNERYAMVGVSARSGNNNHTERFAEACRIHNMYALNVRFLRVSKIRFDTLPLMEDFFVNLSLLTRGFSTGMICDRMWGQQESNAPGGCSTYRDGSLQEKSARGLAEHFPNFVTVVTKQTKGGWFGGERYDVRVQWKKARDFGLENLV
jgi:hypothetical protein